MLTPSLGFCNKAFAFYACKPNRVLARLCRALRQTDRYCRRLTAGTRLESYLSSQCSSPSGTDNSQPLFLPFKGKEQLTAELVGLFRDLNTSRLRVIRPSKPVFLCGGVISNPKTPKPLSLREYILRNYKSGHPTDGQFVLAELANQLYRDTSYSDLITFEEEIAKIASIILVIAESPGSLAELGAFASNTIIRPKVRIILKEKHANEESFIRFGPVERIKNDNNDYVAIYPWRTNKDGNIVIRSARPHKGEMLKFIHDQLAAVPKTELFDNLNDSQIFFIIQWIIYVAYAITHLQLHEITNALALGVDERAIKNVVYCLRLVGWIKSYSYSSKEYLYAPYDQDPFDYAFNDGVADTDSVRRKEPISRAIHRGAALPPHVRKLVAASRAAK